jgi:hypothetical protein
LPTVGLRISPDRGLTWIEARVPDSVGPALAPVDRQWNSMKFSRWVVKQEVVRPVLRRKGPSLTVTCIRFIG